MSVIWFSKKFYCAVCEVMLGKMKLKNTKQILINPVEVHLRAVERSVRDSDIDFDVEAIDSLYWVYSSARDIHRSICPDIQFDQLEAPKSVTEGLDMFGDIITSVFGK